MFNGLDQIIIIKKKLIPLDELKEKKNCEPLESQIGIKLCNESHLE